MQTIISRSILATAITFTLSTAFAANVPEGTKLATKQHIVINNGAEPQSLDPHKVEGVPESQIMRQMFEGLTTIDENGNTIPGIATSWENSDDFKTWTFHLRPNAKWSNGDPITAHDFVFAWQRLVAPATASPYASYLTYLQVENAQDIIDGKKKHEELGVEAKDDYTLVIHLSNPVPYVVDLTTHTSLVPVNKKVIEKFGNDWVKPENFVGNGAYILKNHIINEKIEFQRNKNYWNDEKTIIDSADFLSIQSEVTDISRYRANEIDIGRSIPTDLFKKLKKEIPDEIKVSRKLSTYLFEINNLRAPFTDIRVRKALNLSLDRNIITDKVLGQGQTPTYVFTPNYIIEGSKVEQPAYSKLPMAERNAQAIKLLEDAGYSKTNPLKFSILYNTNESHKQIAIAVAAMWKTNSKGLIDVKLENQEWKTFLDTRHNKNFDIARAGWSADYNQATTFVNYFLSNSSHNTAFYANPTYDAAVAESYKATDATGREIAYAKAEKILAEDFAIIPIYNYVSVRLVKPYVKGYTATDPQDNVLLRNLYLVEH